MVTLMVKTTFSVFTFATVGAAMQYADENLQPDVVVRDQWGGVYNRTRGIWDR